LQAEAALKSAQIDLRYTKVLAPISGRIGRSSVTEGALVSNGQTNAMATIQQLDPIYVDVTQSTAELLKLRRDLESGQLQKAGDNAAKCSWCWKTAACSSSKAAWSSRKSRSTKPPAP
jgi:membrane fusion protein (multidrug efflux system)